MPDTLWHIAGWAIALLGAPLLARALLADRAKGRRRCPKCWYAMDGVPATPPDAAHPSANPTYLCPECGHTARSEKALLKTRRRLKLLPLTLVAVALGYATWTIPRIKREGALGLVPTTWLILSVPYPETDFLAMPTQRHAKLQGTLRARVSDPKHQLPPQILGWQTQLWDWSLRARFQSRSGLPLATRELITTLDATGVSLPTFRLHEGTSLHVSDVASTIQRTTSVPVRVRDCGERMIDLQEPRASASRTLDLLCDASYATIVWTIGPTGIDIMPRENAPASLLCSYDVEILINAKCGRCTCSAPSPVQCRCIIGWRDDSAELIDAISTLVYPDDWRKNGGDLAYAEAVGPTLFVVAPAVAQARIGQLLDALRDAKLQGQSHLDAALGPVIPQSLGYEVPSTVAYRIDPPASTPSTSTVNFRNSLNRTLCPHIWQANGGNGGCMETVGDLLIVVAPKNVQALVAERLTQLKTDGGI